MKVALYCMCGGSVKGTIHPAGEARFRAMFWSEHQGAGHGPTDAQTARKAREAEEREQGPESVDWPTHVIGGGAE